MLNKLLEEQIQKYLGGTTTTLPENYTSFLKVISDSYDHYETKKRSPESPTEPNHKEQPENVNHHELNRILKNIEEVVFSRDMVTDTYRYISESCEKIYGYSVDDFFADPKLWKQLIHPEDISLIDPHDEKLHKGEELHVEFRIIHKNGTIRWLKSRVIPTLDDSGKLLFIDAIVNDITETKEAQHKLEEAHGELNRLFNTIDEVLFSVDMKTFQITHMSAASEKIYGYTPAEFFASRDLWQDIIHPDDKHIAQQHVQDLNQGKQVFNQYRIIHKNGSIRWIENKIIPTLDATGQLVRLDGVTTDVTEKIVSEKKLKKSERMMSDAQRIAHFGSWELSLQDLNDLQRNSLTWSDEVFRIFGYEPETHQASIENFFKAVHPDELKRVREAIRKALDEKSYYAIDHRIIHTNGTVKWVKEDAAIILDKETGKPQKMIGTIQDITERKEAEEKLRRSEKMMSDAQRVAHFGSWEVDLLDNTDLAHNPLRWSDEVYRIFGISTNDQKEASVQDFYKAVHPDDLDHVKEAFVTALNEDSYYTVEYRIFHSDGTMHWMQQGASVIRDEKSGDLPKMVGTVQDITTRKITEEALRKSEVNLTAIIENTDAYIYSLDKEFRYITFNSFLENTMKKIYGIDIKPGMQVYEFLQKLDKKEAQFWEDTYTKAITMGEPLQFVKEYTTNEYQSYVHFFVNPIFENGQAIGLSCMARDITQQKMAEEALRKSEANIHSIFDNTETIYILLDRNLKIASFNPAASYWAKHELNIEYKEGDSFVLHYAKNRQEDMWEKARRVLKGELVNYEANYPQADGSVNCYAVSVRPILDNEGKIVGICIAANNITERKRSEESLQKSEANLRTIFQHTENAYLLIDTDLKIISLNQKVIDFAWKDLGKMPVEGTDVIGYFAENRQETLRDMMLNIIKDSTQHYHYEISYLQKDLSTTWYDVQLFGVSGSEKKVTALMMSLTDISESKAVADKIRLSEERYRLVSESAVLGVAWGTIDGTLLNANKTFCDMLGYTKAEILKKHFSRYTHHDDVVKEMNFIHQMLNGEIDKYQLEKRYITKQKDIIWVEISASCAKDEAGDIQFVILLTQDITSRKNAEQSLQKSEERYRQIVETAQEGIWVMDEDSRTVFVNKKMTEVFEYSSEEMIGKQLFDFMDNEGKIMAIKSIKQRGLEMEDKQEFRFVTKSGHYIWTNLSTTSIIDENGQHKGALAMVTDITHRRRAEEALHKSEANLRNILENTDTAYVLLNEKAEILSFNNLAKRLAVNELEGSMEEGKNYIDLMGHNRRNEVKKIIKQVLTSEKQVSYEVKYSKPNNTATWLHISMHPIFNSERTVLGLSVAATDITKRKAAEELLQKSEANLRTIFNNTTISYVLMDVNFRIVSFNQRAARGYKKELGKALAEGNHFFDYLSEERKVLAKKRYEAVLKGEKINYETSFNQPDGSVSWYNINLFPVSNGEANIYGMIIASEDITERKRAELERETMTSDIIQRNKDLEQFAYIISHNLRSPVANILGLSNIIRSTPSLSKQDLTKCLDGLFLAVTKLDEVIMDLNYILQVRREINEKKEAVHFSKIISDVKASIDNLVKKEKVTIKTNFKEVDEFFTLKSYLNSIFYNLISNSIKYRSPEVRPLINISSKIVKNKIQIIYKDNGLGIDLSLHADKIFGLYKKFHLHTEGKGMGLYMVKTQVEILGGKISLKSEKNKGVEFLIEFTVPEN